MQIKNIILLFIVTGFLVACGSTSPSDQDGEEADTQDTDTSSEGQGTTDECTITITDKETASEFLQGEDSPSEDTIEGLKAGCAASDTDVDIFMETFLCFVGIDPTLATDPDIQDDTDNIEFVDLDDLQNSCEGEIARL